MIAAVIVLAATTVLLAGALVAQAHAHAAERKEAMEQFRAAAREGTRANLSKSAQEYALAQGTEGALVERERLRLADADAPDRHEPPLVGMG